ncbi:MAG TPA: 3-methyl-2-oxobutanoate hydroxymethyltransferase [Gammaproteobacteria bacterium]|nr:3-methyl-2-oxobutanoate hydroxymethyltransferase [Gammaproteobacteria bacterium]
MYTQLTKNTGAPALTLAALGKMKQAGEKIACLTAYDASFAALLDAAGVDLVLVGDTLGMVVQGQSSTVPVSMDDMVYHTRLVSRGLSRAYLVADMPFLSYVDVPTAVRNAGRFMQEAGARMVKLEGTGAQAEIVAALAANGIPVCAHLGLRPQAVEKLSGFRIQGREPDAAKRILDDARELEQAGADIILLECIPRALAAKIHASVSVPVIGIGAGADVDGQILVLYDVLDITPGRKPSFAKNFMHGAASIRAAVENYVTAVKQGDYPAAEHGFD